MFHNWLYLLVYNRFLIWWEYWNISSIFHISLFKIKNRMKVMSWHAMFTTITTLYNTVSWLSQLLNYIKNKVVPHLFKVSTKIVLLKIWNCISLSHLSLPKTETKLAEKCNTRISLLIVLILCKLDM